MFSPYQSAFYPIFDMYISLTARALRVFDVSIYRSLAAREWLLHMMLLPGWDDLQSMVDLPILSDVAVDQRVSSGKLLHSELERSTIFDW